MSNKFTVTNYAAVASAVAMACGTFGAASAYAGTVVSPSTITRSGSAANGAAAATADLTISGTTLSVNLEASYAPNDTIVISIAGGQLRSGTSAATPSMTCAATASTSTLLLGFVSKTSSAVTYRVTGGTGLEKTGFSCSTATAGYSIVRNSVTSTGTTGVTLSTASYINGGTTAFDTQTTANPVLLSVAQFSVAAITQFNASVSVATNRLAWVGSSAASPATSATFSLQLSGYAADADNGATDANLLADVSTVTAVANVYGTTATPMFAWLDDDANGCTADDLTAGPGSASITSGGSLAISANCATITMSFPAAVGGAAGTRNRTVTLTLAKQSSSTGLAIQQGSFSDAPSFVVSNASSATQTITAAAAGTFGIDGALINIPYMPYGTSGTSLIEQAIYITNTSTTAGVVTGTARNQAGVSCNLGTVGTAAAQAVTNLSTGINNAIATCYATAGVFPAGTRVYIDLISNTAIGNTLVNAAYNVGGSSRVQVTNDSAQFRQIPRNRVLVVPA